jgi:hypothetical protein
MKKLLLELIKVTLLFFCITIGVIIFKAEPAEAKGRKILGSNSYLYEQLNKKERDEYMQYLRILNKYNNENPIYKKQM